MLTDRAISDAYTWVQAWQQRSRVPGLAFVVTDPDATRFVGLSGVSDTATGQPLAEGQRWQIGSISKALTATVLLQLAGGGQLRVDDLAVEHLPWASDLHPEATVHHLLTHTAGLPQGSEWAPDSRLETATLGRLGLPQQPGLTYHYSNCGYEALGDVVERHTGLPIERALEQHVLRPLGMDSSSGSVRAHDRHRDVHGHRPLRDDVRYRADEDQVPDFWYPTCTADGAVVATPHDMAAYLRFLIRGGCDGVLDAAGFALLSARHVRVDDHRWYGYGLMTTDRAAGPTIGHGGGMVGMYADVRVDRARGIGTCLLVNGHCDPTGANAYLLDLLRSTMDSTQRPEPPALDVSEPVDDADGPGEWAPMVGLYRSFNPWQPSVRIIRTGDALHLADPVDGWSEPLVPEGPTRFRVGGPSSPDCAEFDVLVDGQFLQLDLSGCRYGRVRRPPEPS